MNEADYLPILRAELQAEEGSFLLQLRCDLTWDKAAFSRLVLAMEQCACAYETASELPRWMADGFWYVEQFVPNWSTHENFPREHAPEYYEAAYERLHDVAYWFFVGASPSTSPLKPM